jgi:hypothetical protein
LYSKIAAIDSVVDDIHDTDLPAVLTEVEYVEEHIHGENIPYGIAAVAPLIASAHSTSPLQVEGGDALDGSSMLLFKGGAPGVTFDIGKIQVSAVDPANSPTDLQFYEGVLGDAVAYTGEADDDIVSAADHGMADGDRFIFDTLNNETYGVTTNKVYFARDVVANVSLKVAEVTGGDAINITTDISGNLKRLTSPTRKTSVTVSMAGTNVDAQPVTFPCPKITSTKAFWVQAKSKSGDTCLVSFFIDLHSYA